MGPHTALTINRPEKVNTRSAGLALLSDRVLTQWPQLLWGGLVVGSILVLWGGIGTFAPALVAVGSALILAVLGASVYLAIRAYRDRPLPPNTKFAIGGMAGFYVAVALTASQAGIEYGILVLAVGLVPMTALFLLAATMREHDREAEPRGCPWWGLRRG